MAVTGQMIVNDARGMLHDVAGTRWTDAQMLVYLNAGRREMAGAKPQLWGMTSKRRVTLLTGGYQTLPEVGITDAFSLIDVLNNVDSINNPSSVVRLITKDQLDAYSANWRTETAAAVQNWFRDSANSLGFWVYPAVPGGKLDITVGVIPGDLAALNEVAIPIDMMSTALFNYVMYRAYAKDAEIAQSAQNAASYLGLFSSAMSA